MSRDVWDLQACQRKHFRIVNASPLFKWLRSKASGTSHSFPPCPTPTASLPLRPSFPPPANPALHGPWPPAPALAHVRRATAWDHPLHVSALLSLLRSANPHTDTMNARRCASSRARPASRSQAALLALCLTGMLLGIQLPVASSMGGGSANDVQGVVFVTHHKTGWCSMCRSLACTWSMCAHADTLHVRVHAGPRWTPVPGQQARPWA